MLRPTVSGTHSQNHAGSEILSSVVLQPRLYFDLCRTQRSDLKDTTPPPPEIEKRKHCLPVGVCLKRTLLPTCKGKKNKREVL